MRIAIDAMGGDNAPEQIVLGVLEACREYEDFDTLFLVGDGEKIGEIIEKHAPTPPGVEVFHASQTIEMHESPVWGLRQKKDSSIARAVDLVKKGEADAVVSAGNTGAVIAATRIKLDFLEGIDRPAIATVMPSQFGVNVLIDAGANVDCRANHFLQFAVMGSVYSQYVLGKPSPKIGLLSVGEEETKGNETTRMAHQLLKSSGLNFIGNVEGRDLFHNNADVIVSDGFTGNVALKTAESLAVSIPAMLKEEVLKSWVSKIGACLMRPAFRALKKKTDYAEYGGALLLGVDGICIICHGRSSAKAIKNAIRVAGQSIRSKMNQHIMEEIAKLKSAS